MGGKTKLKEYLENSPKYNQCLAAQANQERVFELLEANGPMTVRAISKATGWEMSKTQSIMQRMKLAGFIEPQRGWKISKRLD